MTDKFPPLPNMEVVKSEGILTAIIGNRSILMCPTELAKLCKEYDALAKGMDSKLLEICKYIALHSKEMSYIYNIGEPNEQEEITKENIKS